MRWSVFVVLLALIASGLGWVVYSHQNRVIVLKEPPASLAQWYKPQSKRQVWLHTMFKLRREMQAVDMYAKAQDGEAMQKWAAKLNEDYAKITEMVPEWKLRVDLIAMDTLQKSVTDKRFDDVATALADMNKNCQSCHADFRAVTATLYRAPDFSKMKVNGATDFNAHMRTLSQQVNRINIAAIDDKQDAALSAFGELSASMTQLGETCATCHKTDAQTYPNPAMSQAMTELERSLRGDVLSEKGKALGTVAVMACAQCHGTHRLSFDAKQLFKDKMSLKDLLRHAL